KDYFSQIKNEAKLLESVMHLRSEQLFIDASKSLTRAIFIMNTLKEKYEYSFIFLEKDIHGVINSMKKDKVTIKLSNGFTKEKLSNNQFNIHNAVEQIKSISRHIRRISKIFGIKGMQVEYEQFTNNPKNVFLNLAKTLKLDWEETMLDLNCNEHHLLGGNYSRINAKTIKKGKGEHNELSNEDINIIDGYK
ncbi:MAG: hypothetical protein ACJA0H_001992, partial [Francisellaceae bacterium]